jgi:HK97 family phage major capsid protein
MVAAGQAPYGRTGDSTGAAGVLPVQKAFALAGGFLDEAQDAEARDARDLSNRIKSVYGPFYGFSNNPRSLLLPASAGYLPTCTPDGHEIPGARDVRKEIGQRVATVKGLDPDEVETKATRGDGLARKALSTLLDTTGGSLVAPPALGDLIDLQRKLEVFTQAGSTSVTLPPNGRMMFPKLTGGGTAYWVGEAGTVTDSQQTTGSLTQEVKTLAVRTPLTNELMRFADSSVDGMVRVDMAKQAALKADEAMLQGTGGTQPKGLITYPSAASWTQGTDKLVAYTVTANKFQPQDAGKILRKLPDGVNATAWVFHPELFAVIENRRTDAVVPGDGTGPFAFNITRGAEDAGPGRLRGVPVVLSRNVSATRGSGAQTYGLCGDFSEWLVGRLGVLEFMVDPYSQMASYSTVVQCVQFIDAGARHAASFVFFDELDLS